MGEVILEATVRGGFPVYIHLLDDDLWITTVRGQSADFLNLTEEEIERSLERCR